ncbi:PAS domain-containing protein [Microcoleus sp. FACHB-SPT15]|uniref:PAS domain-containing protein n=1 Tax=Microcoleus sp. FACHB-SPT15 TaxID=2692830 RepID=UPI00177AEBF2|nr:PAS domain-containing protein [Microcoleus sp. FACHB-SPT15]MBD1809731.1 PAS domain-containing protein [Microcoleus sp. FACHB-SPT15]
MLKWQCLNQLWKSRSHQGWQFRNLLVLLIIGSTTLAVSSTAILSYQVVRELLLGNLKQNTLLRVQVGVDEIDNWLAARKAEIAMLANTPTVRTMDWSVAKPYFTSEVSRLKDFYFFAMINPDGSQNTTGKGRAKNVKDREYFKRAMSGQVYVGDPVISRTHGGATVPMGAPVWSIPPAHRRSIGIIGAAIKIDRIVEVVNRLKYGSGSYAFALTSEGMPIVHPNARVMGTWEKPAPSFLQASDPNLRHLATRMVGKQRGIELVQLAGDWVYVGYLPLHEADWSIALVIPKHNIESQLSALNLLATVVGGLLAIATLAGLRLVLISERSRARAAQEALLNRLIERIRASLELEQILQATVEEVGTLLQLERVVFGWYEPTELSLEIQRVYCQENLLPQVGRFSVPPDFEVRTQRGESIQLQEVKPSPQPIHLELNAQSYLALPVRTENELIAYLILVRDTKWFNLDGEKELLQAVADQLAIAITQSHLYLQTKEQAQRLDLALDQSALVAITDPNGIITHINDNFCQLSQYSREELIGQDYRLLTADNHFQEFAQKPWLTLARKKIWKGEVKNRAKDGTDYWLDTTIFPFLNAKGKPIQYLAASFNITPRKETEAALRQSEARFRLAVDNFPHPFIIYNAKRQFQFVNLEGLRRTEKPLEELIGLTDEEIWSSEVTSKYLPILQRAVETRTIQTGECDITLPTVGSFTIVVNYVPLFDEQGEISQILGITQDITDRKRAEFALQQLNQELEQRVQQRTTELEQTNARLQAEIKVREQAEADLWESQQQLQAILDNSPTLIFVIDRQNRHLLSNRSYENLLSTTHEQLIGKSIYDVWGAEFAEAFATINKQVLDQCLSIETEEVAPLDDGIHTYLVNKFPLLDANGVPYAVCGISTDITERKRTEQKLEQLTTDLKRSNQELEQFAYVASHDLQEPLRAITGFTQLLRQDYQNQLDESAQEYMTYIVDGAARMQELIQDLLTYCRLGTDHQGFAAIDCNAVVRQAIANLEIAIADSNATVTHESLPTIKANKTQLIQLFQNLISNAVKFHRDEPPEVHIQAQLRNQEWLFFVRDNGIGIESKYLTRIFEVFKRLHSRTEFSGTGIGLAICKKIVESHSGSIWAESQPGLGTTFYFKIPLAPPQGEL